MGRRFPGTTPSLNWHRHRGLGFLLQYLVLAGPETVINMIMLLVVWSVLAVMFLFSLARQLIWISTSWWVGQAISGVEGV